MLLYLLECIVCVTYTLRTNGEEKLALTLTDQNVGFTKYDPSSEEQKIEIVDGSLIRNNKRVCVSPSTSRVRLCQSRSPIHGIFEPIEQQRMFKFTMRGSQVLAIGEYNQNTQMHDAVVIDETNEDKSGGFWFVLEPRTEELSYSKYGAPW